MRQILNYVRYGQGQDSGAERDAHPAGDEDQSRSRGHRPQAGVTEQRWWRVADIDADSPE